MRVPSFDSGAVNLPRVQGQGPGPVIGPSMAPRIAESAQDIEQGNAAVQRIGLAMQRVENEARVDAEDNGLADRFREVFSKFEPLAGVAAVDAAPGIEKQLRDMVATAERSLQNDVQRMVFRDRANRRLESALDSIARKKVRETVNMGLAQKGEFVNQGALDYAVEAAGEDPANAQATYTKTLSAYDELATAQGLPDDLRESGRLKLTTEMHAGALKRLADSGAMFRAAGYLEAHRGEMTKDAAATWESTLRKQGETAQAVVLAQELRQLPRVADRLGRADEMLVAGTITEGQHEKLVKQIQVEVAREQQQRALDQQTVRAEAVQRLDAMREQIAQSVAGPLPRAPWSTLEEVLPPSLLVDVDRLGLRDEVQDYMDNKGRRATPEGIARYDTYMAAPEAMRGVPWEVVSGELWRGLDKARFDDVEREWRKANAAPKTMEAVPNFDADFRRLIVNQLLPDLAGRKPSDMAQPEIDAQDAMWQKVQDAVLAANPKNAVEARKYAQEIAKDWAMEMVQSRQTGQRVLPNEITEQNLDDLFVEDDFDENAATPTTRVDLRDLRVGETLRRTEAYMLARAAELRKTHVPSDLRRAAYLEAAAREGNRAVMARSLGEMREVERMRQAEADARTAAATAQSAAARIAARAAEREALVRTLAPQRPDIADPAVRRAWLERTGEQFYDLSDGAHTRAAHDWTTLQQAAGVFPATEEGRRAGMLMFYNDFVWPKQRQAADDARIGSRRRGPYGM